MTWRIEVADYENLERLVAYAAEDANRYLAAYAELGALRSLLGTEDELTSRDCQPLRQALKRYGAVNRGHNHFADAAEMAALLTDEDVRAQFSFLGFLCGPDRLGVSEQGARTLSSDPADDYTADIVESALWSALRIGRRIIERDGAMLYPAKVALLLSGAVVAPDVHVKTQLRQLGFDGLADRQGLFSLSNGEWSAAQPPQHTGFRKLLALMYIANDLWHRDERLRALVARDLPSANGAPGRVLDLLLLTVGQRQLNVNTYFHAVPLPGRWYMG